MVLSLNSAQCRNFELSSRKEWLLSNGIGGFAMGTVAGCNARRYHGHLVAAQPAPAHRSVLLANIEAHVQDEGPSIGISCNQYVGAVNPLGYEYLENFSVGRFARWRYKVDRLSIEKRLAIHPGLNAITVVYENTGKRPLGLTLRPLVQHKFYHGNFRFFEEYPQAQHYPKGQTIIEHSGLSLHLAHPGAQRTPVGGWYYRFENLRELDRGLDPRDDCYCPCELHYELVPGESAVLVCALGACPEPFEDWTQGEPVTALGDMLREAGGRFLVQTPTRTSIIAGYPWFTDWGRDTMIALPGLCLHSGRIAMARTILRDYASQIRQGLIPNRFVEKGEEPEYNTVDATLWFVNAIYQTLETEWDEDFAEQAWVWLNEIVDWHEKGTFFGIHMDKQDGLLTQGAEGVQLTWMDAKIGDWVVTPRHGKPVEINGLWVNALRIAAWLAAKLGQSTARFDTLGNKAAASFESRFWRENLGFYMDTLEPDDASLRPNQVIAMALPFSPCDPDHANLALSEVSRELLTPFGLRTLAPRDANYKGRFRGGMEALDSAYHQGTVWPWLMGSYITALVKLTGDTKEARRLLKEGKNLLAECGLGGIAEVYDGDEPRSPGGCPWQAWSVAEWLRAWVEDVGGK